LQTEVHLFIVLSPLLQTPTCNNFFTESYMYAWNDHSQVNAVSFAVSEHQGQ